MRRGADPVPTLKTLIFDLDGTLIDSAPGILTCFRAVLAEHGIAPQLPLDARLIGPPLAETLVRLGGFDDASAIAPLIDSFKRYYDVDGVRATPAYPGVPGLLDGLRNFGIDLHIATNKRLAPSLSILDRLGLRQYFTSVYALDMATPRIADKASLIERQIVEQGIAGNGIAYVGDKDEDGIAAAANDLPFIAAAWGYGDFAAAPTSAGWRRAESPTAILDIVRCWS